MRLTSSSGVLVANTFSSSRLYDHESTTYASVFGRFFNLKGRNRVILLRQDGLPPPEALRQNAAQLQPTLGRFGIDPAWLLPLFDTGALTVPIAETYPLAQAAEAYDRFRAGGKLGKIVLLM